MHKPESIMKAALLLATAMWASPSLAQATSRPAGQASDDSFFSGTIPADPALVGVIPLPQRSADPAAPGTIRLTPEQREAALEDGAARPRTDIDGNPLPDRAIHGEMGVAIGTGGYRSAYGTAVVPLGDNGAAAFSYETDRFNTRRRRR